MPDSGPKGSIAEAFESQRDRLRAVAFRVLGSHANAEDVVQEAWLRLSRQDTASVHNLAGWLTTVVGRISLDVLRSRQTRSEVSYDAQPSDFTVTLDDAPAPDDDAALADSVGLALLVVLDSLRPDERLAFVLHEVFGVPYAEIAAILDKSTDATKMLASRARRRIQDTRRSTSARRQQREVVQAFLQAAATAGSISCWRCCTPRWNSPPAPPTDRSSPSAPPRSPPARSWPRARHERGR